MTSIYERTIRVNNVIGVFDQCAPWKHYHSKNLSSHIFLGGILDVVGQVTAIY
jgi:hypothetical protein